MNQYLQQIQSIALPNKYTKYYVAIIKKAQLRPQNRKELVANIGYVENHHILPKCFALGGVRDKLNMVFLTAKEHFIVHLCATRMFQNIKCSQMTFAFRQLRSANAHQSYRYMNSGLYAQLKPCFKQYVRLYKGENRKHIYIGDHDIINALLAEGWSKTMTVEYKVGRVGMMLGKKHSEETRLKISAAQIGVPRPKQRGIKHSLERIAKYKAAVLKVKVERPDEYAARCTKLSEILKAAYANGSIEKQMGMKNPCYGKHLSEAHKLKIRIGIQESHAIKQADTQKYEAYIRIRKSVTKKMWQNPELKARAKTYNSKAMQQYGLTPQAFYDQKLKPLLYLGFLPKSIVRYKLLNMSAGSIGRLIRNFCTETDKQQYAENKKMAVGSNHSYIAFLEVQYKTHFAAKLPDFSTLRNSKVLKKYGMLPHEYYAQKLKPLLYLGFPPSAMLRYKLVNLSLNGVVRMIKKFGSPEDLAQYKSNVTKVGGGSKTYNKFLDSQYLKYAGEDS